MTLQRDEIVGNVATFRNSEAAERGASGTPPGLTLNTEHPMPKATPTTTTSGRAPPVADAATPLPSIIDLARYAGTVSTTTDRVYDIAGSEDNRLEKGLNLGRDQERCINNLILTMRATTLADAAAQLHVAFDVVCDLENELTEAQRARNTVKLRRLVLSCLPIVAKAAGVDLADLGAGYVVRFADDEFPPLTQAAEAAT